MQTAVSWLEQEFIKLESTIGVHGKMYELIEQAKEMEKQQIINTYKHAQVLMVMDDTKRAEQFYYETYGSKGIALQNQSESKVIIELDNLPKEVKKDSFGEISDHAILTEATDRYVIEDEIEAFIQGAEWMQEQLKKKQ